MSRDEAMALAAGTPVRVNSRGDIAMDGDNGRHVVGRVVLFQRLTKGGMAEVNFDGHLYYVPPKNVEMP